MGYDLSAESRTVFRSMDETLAMWRAPFPQHDDFRGKMFELLISTKSKSDIYREIRGLYLEVFEAAERRVNCSHSDKQVVVEALRFVATVKSHPEYRNPVVSQAYWFARIAGIA